MLNLNKIFGNRREEALKSLHVEDPIAEAKQVYNTTEAVPVAVQPKALSMSNIKPPVEEVSNNLVDKIVDHGFEKISGEFRQAQDSFTARHTQVVKGIILELRRREEALIQEIANRQKDLREVQFGIYGYEMALRGFEEIHLPTPDDSVTESEQMVDNAVANLEKEAEASMPLIDLDDLEITDDPRLPETESEVVADQEQAQKPIDFTAVRGKGRKANPA